MARNLETRLHISLLHYLLAVLPLKAAATLTHVANGENRNPVTGALLKRMGMRRGVEDLQFIWDGIHYAIEIKIPGAYQSPYQKEREAAVVAAGGFYAVSRSTQDIDDLLAHWNIPTRAKAGLR